MERLIQVTADGSPTIAIPDMQVTYHSKHGAVQESMHVFIEAGLRYQQKRKDGALHILEMGFGTGLNALLTLVENRPWPVYYESLETFPLEPELVNALDYGDVLQEPAATRLLQQLHDASWQEWVPISPSFQLYKRKEDLLDFQPAGFYDIIYFDAFAPTAQPALWTAPVFKKLEQCMHTDAVLVTYCSKGEVRRAMTAAGLQVEKIPGPPGKREMVRAFKTN
ncbi:tRNA (5-methylaminomethyl-2-thiouridine)(34)-methyltransferase MnmD [Flavihumibacter sp. CACIAM 22H1]|uniref:tRNA (5-methylaminomethyl-2-thiouridine)(34)-methyltransferase MnmD n=1 Tax=Flavihumibacter sp. CACIAM 22H1 TaxID=1812911 RepID=UPI0007A7DB42|nr:tRNA (5-methylaminomethyl-2-thiouridine)(34)-methyltransferase MnmD [Flavihumibacter sp. CACIAM 22H1]KYP15421.1 MAG: hypothetical protein A1D16_12920 [Flavihumibacter sp. CACIAM 22H1]